MQPLFPRIEAAYRVILRFALRHRVAIVLGSIAVFLGSLSLTRLIGKEFVPAQDESQFNIQVETPLGSSTERTSRIMKEIERRVRQLPQVRNLFMTIGAGQQERVNVATLLVQLTDKSTRSIAQQEIMALAREPTRHVSRRINGVFVSG